MRWAARHAMPIHRLPGSGASVFAFASEIDGWLARSGDAAVAEAVEAGPAARIARRRMAYYIGAATLGLGVIAAAFVAAPMFHGGPRVAPALRGVPLPADPAV